MKLFINLLFVILSVAAFQVSAETFSKEYCIIGAGPAGLQYGHFLQKAGRDYVVFEKSGIPGKFFELYPKHRKLISINKRFTGRTNKEFNLRHDWNSILSDNDDLLFKHYSKDYFPHADVMLTYLRDYQTKLNINVMYNTEISELTYHNTSDNDKCRFTMQDQRKTQICCKYVFVAIGFETPVVPTGTVGYEYMTGYEDISTNPEDYEDKSVLIIGYGNSGMETAQAVYGSTNYVHLMGRNHLKLSWETHYVGDIRGVNNEILDAYMLKSLDGVLEADTRDIKIYKRSDGKLMVQMPGAKMPTDRDPLRDGYDIIIRCLGWKWNDALFSNSTKPGSSTMPRVIPNKYPSIGYDYQSTLYPGMYFMGTLAHSIEFRKSAGGFIHGFRYSIRALHRMLEWRNHGVTWPTVTRDIDQIVPLILKRCNEASGIYQMFSHLGDVAIVDRMKNSFVYLEDYPLNLVSNISEYTGFSFDGERHSLFILSLQYGHNFSIVGQDHFSLDRAVTTTDLAHRSNFLHPVIYYYKNRLPSEYEFSMRRPEEMLPKPDTLHHILEDFTSQYDGQTTHVLPFRRFVEFSLNTDLRMYTFETCIAKSLITADASTLPIGCKKHLQRDMSAFTFM